MIITVAYKSTNTSLQNTNKFITGLQVYKYESTKHKQIYHQPSRLKYNFTKPKQQIYHWPTSLKIKVQKNFNKSITAL